MGAELKNAGPESQLQWSMFLWKAWKMPEHGYFIYLLNEGGSILSASKYTPRNTGMSTALLLQSGLDNQQHTNT